MKKTFFTLILFLISFFTMAQKASIQILSTSGSGLSDWQILDDQNNSVYSGAANQPADSVNFNLDPNRIYTFKISVYEIYKSNADLFTLVLNHEPLIRVTSDIGTGVHSIPFFTGVKAVNAKITGGTNALISDFPWQIYYISGNFRCGGSIINGNWVVTAAHCTKNSTGGSILASDMFVKVGANNPANAAEGKTYAVNKVIVHEGFDDVTLLNDIALLRLTDTINFANATPINLIGSDDVAVGAILPGVLSWVSGWGLTSVSPQVIPTVLQKVQLPLITNQQASSVWNSIPATDLMAGFLNGNKDACNGDSGGPLVVPVSGEFKLAGIVSWGSSSCNTYGAYSRVSDFESWIEVNTGLAPAGDSVICQGTVSSQYSVPPIPGSSAYQWVLSPSGAGVISGNGRKASVNWNLNYSGKASIILKATINGKVSDWFRVHASISPVTKILSRSADTIICAGKPVTLNVKVAGHDLIYVWSKDGQVVQTGASSNLSIASAKASDSGAYNCQITGSCGPVVSTNINLTVYPVTKIVTLSPNAEISFGRDLTLDVTAEGHDLVYQWFKDGVEISNSNTSQLVVHGVNATDIGLYRTTVSGTCGTVRSDSIYVYVKRTNSTSDPEVFVWPSVTSTAFSVAINNDSFYNIQIFNTSGKKFRELTNCQYLTRIDISTMAKGEYVVLVYNGAFRKSIKIIKV